VCGRRAASFAHRASGDAIVVLVTWLTSSGRSAGRDDDGGKGRQEQRDGGHGRSSTSSVG
jgi:hypothetical protein